jgi:hypothetical protein
VQHHIGGLKAQQPALPHAIAQIGLHVVARHQLGQIDMDAQRLGQRRAQIGIDADHLAVLPPGPRAVVLVDRQPEP